MKNRLKFAALQALFALASAFLCLLIAMIPGQRGDTGFIFGSLLSGCLFALGPVLASKKEWLSFSISRTRAVLAAVPLPFLGVAFFIGMVGWGDPQEHLIRGVLHTFHREMTDRFVGALIAFGIVIVGAAGVAGLLWLSLSILTMRWRAKMLVVMFAVCLGFCALFWGGLFAGDKSTVSVATECALFVVALGFLFGLAVESNATAQGIKSLFRISAALLATGIVAGSVVMYAGSKPEKRYPGGLESPLWNFDINSSGCHTDWIGPDSSEAANEVRFVNDKTLAMAFGTYVQSVEGPKFESKSCVFTLDVPSGKLIAQTVIDGERPFVRSRPDGNFTIGTGWKGESKTFTPELHEIEKDTFRETGKTGTGAQFGDFRTDQSGNLWFKRTGKEELLAKYGAQGSLQPLGESRMLVLAGRGFFLYTNGGELIAKETFVREGVHFAGLSSDHGRFAVSVFLWGVGDPSYLEEERIVVYDCQTGNAIASVVAEPLPTTQSWTALSPNGTFLVVGAKSQLRLFRLPASPPSHQR